MKNLIHSFQNIFFPDWLNLILGIIFRLIFNYFDYIIRRNIPIKIDNSKVKLSFGGILHSNNTIIHGGKVKLLELKKNFIFDEKNFNVLYLVSSVLSKNILSYIKWARKNKVKIVLNQNGVAYPAWRGYFYRFANYINKLILHKVDYVLYQSKFCKKSADLFLGKFNGPSKIIYNSINIDFYKPAKVKLSNSPLILLLAGTQQAFYRVKLAILTLNEVIKKGINTKLFIAGRLDWKNAYKETEKIINNLNLSNYIEFIGSFKQEEAPMIYQKAHIFLHTKYNDPCPTVVIEALSCGLPVVATKSGGLPELIGEDCGICVEVIESYKKIYEPKPSDLCNAIIKIKNNYIVYSKNALERARNYFSSKDWIKKHKKIFKEILANE